MSFFAELGNVKIVMLEEEEAVGDEYRGNPVTRYPRCRDTLSLPTSLFSSGSFLVVRRIVSVPAEE